MSKNQFDVIILNGRPAAGKSEVIDYLKSVPVNERLERFHIGEFEELDDFPVLWERFLDDDILQKHGQERMFTDDQYYFKDHFLWNFFILKLAAAYAEIKTQNPDYHKTTTTIIEFSRGGKNAFAEAYSYLGDDILKRAGIVYIDVPYEESVRKNQRRARPGEEGSILHHSLPDDKMDFYYKTNDWHDIAPDKHGHIDVKGQKVPYAVFPNMPEVTDKPETLGKTLEVTLQSLWKLRSGS